MTIHVWLRIKTLEIMKNGLQIAICDDFCILSGAKWILLENNNF